MTEPARIVAIVLLPLVAVNWAAALSLLRLARSSPRIRALTERAWLAALIAVVVTITAAWEVVPDDGLRALSIALMLAVSAYPLWWLWSYYTGRF